MITERHAKLIQRLCTHHVVDQFNNGSGNHDKMLRVEVHAITRKNFRAVFFIPKPKNGATPDA